MRLTHLGLPVRDVRRSQDFYQAYFGFDPATAQRYDDGTVIIRNQDAFDLALHPTAQVGPLPPFLHFGFRLPHPETQTFAAYVRTRRPALNAPQLELRFDPG